MLLILILGIFIILVGAVIVLYPTSFARLSNFMNRKVFDDNAVLGHRILFAIICFAVGIMFILTYFRII